MPTSWHVAVAAESLVASLFARTGFDVSVQYGADQPEYDLMIAQGDKLAKISAKGSQDGNWGLTQKYLRNADYQRAIGDWEKAHSKKLLFAFVQFKNVDIAEMPRVYLATVPEIAVRLRATAAGRGDTILYEKKLWTARAKGAGTEDAIPQEWTFSERRIHHLLEFVTS